MITDPHITFTIRGDVLEIATSSDAVITTQTSANEATGAVVIYALVNIT